MFHEIVPIKRYHDISNMFSPINNYFTYKREESLGTEILEICMIIKCKTITNMDIKIFPEMIQESEEINIKSSLRT